MYCHNATVPTAQAAPTPSPPPVTRSSTLRTGSPSSSSRLDQRRDQQTGRRLRYLDSSCRPGSSLPAAEGPAGSTSVAAAARIVPQEDRTGPVVARSRDLAGMGWANHSNRCRAGPAGMAACRPGCMDRHLDGLVAATEGTAAVRPTSELAMCS
jgi:hypothetical protein